MIHEQPAVPLTAIAMALLWAKAQGFTLEELGHGRGARIYAEIVGYGMTCDADSTSAEWEELPELFSWR